MSTIESPAETPEQAARDPLPRSTLLVMAAACGLAVANIYYNQPMLEQIADSLGRGAPGLVPTVTQIGYALGLLLLAPLGDRFDRRRVILIELGALVLALVAAAAAPRLALLAGASLAIGVAASLVQSIVPLAAHLAPPERRGQVVGTVMSGLLIGILGARVLSGVVAQYFGWRVMFWIAAAMMIGLFGLLWRTLPSTEPAARIGYGRLMASLWALLRDEPVLREAAGTGAAMFGAFSVFWATLTLLLASPAYRLGPQAAGLFGLVGIVGALAAPVAGRLADRGGPRRVVGIAIAITAAAYLVFLVRGGESLAMLVVGVLLLDLGVQAAQISNQARIYTLQPEARSRINTVFMVIYFVGGASGSALSALAWTHFGWLGVSVTGLLFCGFGAYVHLRALGRRAAGFLR